MEAISEVKEQWDKQTAFVDIETSTSCKNKIFVYLVTIYSFNPKKCFEYGNDTPLNPNP